MEGVTVSDKDGTELVKSKVMGPIPHSLHALHALTGPEGCASVT